MFINDSAKSPKPLSTDATRPVTDGNGAPSKNLSQWRNFMLTSIGLALCFIQPLYDLAKFAKGSELYSHILLIPAISLYLIWVQKKSLPAHSSPTRGLAMPFFIAGLIMLAVYWFALRPAAKLNTEDYLATTIFCFLLFLFGIACVFLGRDTLRKVAFPIGFLIFIVPFPTFVMDGIEVFLQHTSAAAAYVMFKLTGTPVFQSGLEFRLPSISLQVAPECSGIHSTLVLFITSMVAGHLFLRSPWKRTILTLAVIPLAIVRNGFRIYTIGELCVHVGPHMIDSPIHHRGGPIFFALSLVPFFLLLYFLRKSDCEENQGVNSKPNS